MKKVPRLRIRGFDIYLVETEHSSEDINKAILYLQDLFGVKEWDHDRRPMSLEPAPRKQP
jgi:hypothetical protein